MDQLTNMDHSPGPVQDDTPMDDPPTDSSVPLALQTAYLSGTPTQDDVQSEGVQSPGSHGGKRKRDDVGNDLSCPADILTARSPRSSYLVKPSHSAYPEIEPSLKRIKPLNQRPEASSKKPVPLYGLTKSLWQRILGLVPPVFLGRILRVSRPFYEILDPVGSQRIERTIGEPVDSLHLDLAGSQEIWSTSRRIFAPVLPKNLPGKTDIEMWRLIRGNHCQLCHGKKLLCTGSGSNLWQSGPGKDGVRVIWLYGVRCCGPCLRASVEQV